jgi:cytosine/adenosine deaminase-related metal-dependent hydrolase
MGMGIDEAGINDDRDMLLEMKLLLRLSRTPGMDDTPFTASEVFRIATEGGAATTPFKGRVGVLKPGYSADCVLFDWAKVSAPFLDGRVPLVDALVQRAQARDISTVLIAGQVVYRDGEFPTVDRNSVMKEIAEKMARPPTSRDLELAQLSADVFPYVKAFYAGYVNIDNLALSGNFNARI